MTPSKSQKGDAAVLLLAALLSELGFTILQPLCEASPFDLAIYFERQLFRIQVKRAQKTGSGSYVIPFRSIRMGMTGPRTSRYTTEDADFIAGVVMKTRDVYFFPLADEVVAKIRASVLVDPERTCRPCATRRVDTERYRNRFALGSVCFDLGS
jgi:hypothetical protein